MYGAFMPYNLGLDDDSLVVGGAVGAAVEEACRDNQVLAADGIVGDRDGAVSVVGHCRTSIIESITGLVHHKRAGIARRGQDQAVKVQVNVVIALDHVAGNSHRARGIASYERDLGHGGWGHAVLVVWQGVLAAGRNNLIACQGNWSCDCSKGRDGQNEGRKGHTEGVCGSEHSITVMDEQKECGFVCEMLGGPPGSPFALLNLCLAAGIKCVCARPTKADINPHPTTHRIVAGPAHEAVVTLTANHRINPISAHQNF